MIFSEIIGASPFINELVVDTGPLDPVGENLAVKFVDLLAVELVAFAPVCRSTRS